MLCFPCVVTSQSTCTGIEKLAADLMANVSGSTCDIDRDNNICNDCLQLNCTIRVGSAFGVALPIPVFSSIYPCYEDNNTHAVEIIFPDLLRIFTINTTSQVVAISLGGFVGDYRVDVTVEQKGNGFNYGVCARLQSMCCFLLLVHVYVIALIRAHTHTRVCVCVCGVRACVHACV